MASKTICVSLNKKTAGCALMPAYNKISLRDSLHSDRPYPFVISIEKILHSAMKVDSLDNDCLPEPPTPKSNMFPFGCLSTLVILAT